MKTMKKIILLMFAMAFILTMTFTAYAAGTPTDGNYKVPIKFTGGSGRLKVSPTTDITVSGGKITAKVVYLSPHFTYMIVNGVKYNNTAAAGENSTFVIPVSALDTEINVTACTVAMSSPYEVDYGITISSQGTTSTTDKNPSKDTEPAKEAKPATGKDIKTDTTKEVPKDSKTDTTKETPKDSTKETPDAAKNTTVDNSKVENLEQSNANGVNKEKEAIAVAVEKHNSNRILIPIIMGATVVIAISIILRKKKLKNTGQEGV